MPDGSGHHPSEASYYVRAFNRDKVGASVSERLDFLGFEHLAVAAIFACPPQVFISLASLSQSKNFRTALHTPLIPDVSHLLITGT